MPGSVPVLPRPDSARLRQRAIAVALMTAAFTLVLCAIVLVRYQPQGALAFAVIGTRFSTGDPSGTVGYDGQFFYFIARDGLNAVPLLDGPTLRLQRIGYPLLARVAGLGHPDGVAWALLGINVLAQSLGAGVLAYLCGRAGGSPWLGLVYGLWIGGQYAVRLNLAEPLAILWSLLAVLAYTHGRSLPTAGLLVLAALTKEQGLVIAAALALHALANRHLRAALLIGGLPVLAFGAWWAVLYAWFGTLPTIYPAAQGIRLLPFNGLFHETDTAEFMLLTLWLALPTAAIALAALLTLIRRRRVTLGIALALAGAGFVMLMPGVSWDDQLAAYRVGVPVIVGGTLFIAQHGGARHGRHWALIWAIGLLSPLLIVPLSPLWMGSA